MGFPSIQHGFSSGEMSPRLFGRVDLAKYHLGCSTLRNFYVDYRGGASSRAGTAYVGMCKQGAPNSGGTTTSNPPRDIPFQFSISQGYVLEFGDLYMRIKSDGAYVVESGTAITAATNASPLVITDVAHSYSNGDWVFITGMVGMTELNGQTWIVVNRATDTYELTDLFGNAVDSTNFGIYLTAGTAQRIYTVVSPYNAIDLPFLKYTQSADTMTLTCVNQQTLAEYQSYELVRNGATNWAFSADSFTASISPPTGVTVVAHASGALTTFYAYVVTSVDANTGEESIASAGVQVQNNDISVASGSNSISWNRVSGAGSYNVYGAIPSFNTGVAIGSSFGYLGTAFGTQFTDNNIIADFTVVPPTHSNPFAPGAIASVTPVLSGLSYSQTTISYNITTATGTGAVILPIVVNTAVVAYIVQNGGKNYAQTDTIAITGGGTSSIATATLNIGSLTGVYPGTCAYFQQRRAYAYTINNPDTYFMSQPGAFSNMDSSIPTMDSDAIIGSPWAQQINGIQFLVPMPGGLVVLTGKGAWQLNGVGGNPITPADQVATPQAYNGCHFHIPPIVVNYDILYVQAKGSIVRDLQYNFFVNIYTGDDKTVLSEHLFNFHQIQQWAYAEEPFKIIWAIRDDGILLSFTYLREQDVYGWARHDTNGLFIGVCSITEPPVDAVYFITKRYIQGKWVYYSERADNRNWQTVEDCFCVDAGLSYPVTFPDAALTPSKANGTNNISDINIISGGQNYTSPTVSALDPTGQGSGFIATLTVSGGVIVSTFVNNEGTNYQPGTELIITDSTGTGGKLAPLITNNVTFTTDTAVFTADNIGDVIRIGNNNASPNGTFVDVPSGGGKAIITDYTSGTIVTANITEEITNIVPNDPNNTPVPVSSGYWSLSTPTDTVSGLGHLEGLEVAILADGSVVSSQVVVDGSITLPSPASVITIGLPFTAQLQTLYLDPQQQTTTQGKRKNIQAVTVRVENSRGIFVGTNQVDASTQPNGVAPAWTSMYEIKQRNSTQFPGSAIPLFTGDLRELVGGDWQKPAQVAIQITDPVPGNILALITEYNIGDTNG